MMLNIPERKLIQVRRRRTIFFDSVRAGKCPYCYDSIMITKRRGKEGPYYRVCIDCGGTITL